MGGGWLRGRRLGLQALMVQDYNIDATIGGAAFLGLVTFNWRCIGIAGYRHARPRDFEAGRE